MAVHNRQQGLRETFKRYEMAPSVRTTIPGLVEIFINLGIVENITSPGRQLFSEQKMQTVNPHFWKYPKGP